MEARQREEAAARALADALAATAHLGAKSTSAELGSGIDHVESVIAAAMAAGGVDVSAARARVAEMRAAEVLPG